MNTINPTTSFTKPSTYTAQVTDLMESTNLILDEFRKVYVISHANPNSQEYQQQFANASSNVDQVQSKLFSMTNDVQSNLDTLSGSLLDLNTQIEIERKRNAKLKKKLGIVEDQHVSASGLINEYKEYYNMNYLRNWGLALSTILCIYAITIIWVPARTAERLAVNRFQQHALLSLIVNTLMFIPCLLGDLFRFVAKILVLLVNALLYIPCLLAGEIK